MNSKRIFISIAMLLVLKCFFSLVISLPNWLFTKLFNPLSPDSDQHQFSPKNIHMLPRQMIMRVIKMITKEKML